MTGGAADRIVRGAARGAAAGGVSAPEGPLPGAPYDLAIGDLLYSQLLYPALVDLGVPEERRAATLRAYAAALTRATVARLHASAPTVVHVHDPLAWWEGHEQPVDLEEILRLADADEIDAALDLVARGIGPVESDPRAALDSLGIVPARDRALALAVHRGSRLPRLRDPRGPQRRGVMPSVRERSATPGPLSGATCCRRKRILR